MIRFKYGKDETGDSTSVTITYPRDDITTHMYISALLDAIEVYNERNSGQRKDVWSRSGLKGQVFALFAKAERAFIAAFGRGELPEKDHLRDAINYAAFGLVLLMFSDDKPAHMTLEGEWPWHR